MVIPKMNNVTEILLDAKYFPLMRRLILHPIKKQKKLETTKDKNSLQVKNPTDLLEASPFSMKKKRNSTDSF